mmetsp:Transcript_16797/g.36234  ORF Transcript_16797/g.36234 Transcript_16797/m.36234 type:complete len:270 (-) Transcript_16797:286-1095(-)
MHIRLQIVRERIGSLVLVGRSRNLLGNNERSTCLVDQHRVSLIHHAKSIEFSSLARQHRLGGAKRQMIPQVIKSQFRIGHVDNVAGIRHLALVFGHASLDQPDGQSQVTMHLSHLLHIPTCQIVIDSDNKRWLSRQSIDITRQRRHERLSLTGSHLGQSSIVQNQPPQQLHVVMTLLNHPPRRFPNDRKRLLQDWSIDILTLGQTGLELGSLGKHVFIAKCLNGRFKFVDLQDAFLHCCEIIDVGFLAGFIITAGHELFHEAHGEGRRG